MNYNSILCRYCEIALKGKNRSMFEQKLVDNMKHVLRKIDNIKVSKTRGRLWIKKETPFNKQETEILHQQMPKLFGLASYSPGIMANPEIESIKKAVLEIAQPIFESALNEKLNPSFRIRARRADKSFPIKSKNLEILIAELVGENFDKDERLRVDLENADITVYCEVRETSSFVYLESFPGPGGLPTGSNSHVLSLLSGGIDSPVASSMLMKRGCCVDFITFHSYPYTPEESVTKVKRLTQILNDFQPPRKLFICNLAELQKLIRDNCSEKFRTILYRRYMFRIAEEIAKKNKNLALVTGEAVGQVASQTIVNLATIEEAIDMLVLRPLAGLDKEDVIKIAKEIDTFDISIEQVPDSCTVFAPNAPATAAKVDKVIRDEKRLDVDQLLEQIIEETWNSAVMITTDTNI